MTKCFENLNSRATSAEPSERTMVSRRGLLLTGLLSDLVSQPSIVAAADNEPGPDGLTAQQLGAALTALQEAVKRDDAEGVAALMSFPLQVNHGSHSEHMGRSRFLARYPQVFTGKVRRALAAQEAQALFRNARGAMVGEGELWLSGVCMDKACKSLAVQVVAVNLD